MKKLIALFALLISSLHFAGAQEVRYAFVCTDSIICALPQYQDVQKKMSELRAMYEKEALHNEQAFQRQFSEFLEGQRSFPEAILAKRQRDLQDAMEKGLAFRRECDVLLQKAESEHMAPIHQLVSETIAAVAQENNYAFVLTSKPAYLNPAYCVDITAEVRQRLTTPAVEEPAE